MELPPDDAQRVDLSQHAIDRRDVSSIILASVIAVVTGMNTNYWGDKLFGLAVVIELPTERIAS
jgi:hypothetical protein